MSLSNTSQSNVVSDENVRALRIVTVDNSSNNKILPKIDSSIPEIFTIRRLSKVSLFVSAVHFLSLLIIAGCLCRPGLITGGLWAALLFLGHGILGLRGTNTPTRAMLLGHAWLSGVVALVGIACAGYLFSGHSLIACISAFHSRDHATVVRLYIVEVISLIASVPSLVGGLGGMVGAVLAVKAAQVPKIQPQPPMIFYLNDWNNISNCPSAPNDPQIGRSNTPPPSYRQVIEESSA